MELNAAYWKAHAQRGAALEGLGRVQEAIQAYEAGLAIAPESDSMRSNAARLRARSRATGASSASSSGTDAGGVWSQVIAGLRVLLVLSLLAYWLVSYSTGWLASLACAGALHAVHLYRECGPVEWNVNFGSRVVQHMSSTLLLSCITFTQATPMFMLLTPVVLFDMVHFAYWLQAQADRQAPGVAGSLRAAGLKIGAVVTERPDFGSLSSAAQTAQVSAWAQSTVARTLVLFGVMLLVMLLTPARSILATIVHWQNLRLAYMTSPSIKAAFGEVDAMFLRAVNHRLCPALVKSGYMTVRGWLAKQGAAPTQSSAGAGGLGSSCAVM